MVNFDYLKEYKPEKITDGFSILNGTYSCKINYARIEEYSGDKEEFKGVKFFRYELEVVDGESAGRRLWKSVNLSDENKVKKLADALWTVGLEFDSEESLKKASELFVEMTLKVRAWGFKPADSDDPVQVHIIKGISTGVTADSSPSQSAF